MKTVDVLVARILDSSATTSICTIISTAGWKALHNSLGQLSVTSFCSFLNVVLHVSVKTEFDFVWLGVEMGAEF